MLSYKTNLHVSKFLENFGKRIVPIAFLFDTELYNIFQMCYMQLEIDNSLLPGV